MTPERLAEIEAIRQWFHGRDMQANAIILGDVIDELKKLRCMVRNSLANNLCSDHRDKQAGKPCLACHIEHLERKLERLNGNQ
jgi:hypothetical protein